MICEVNYTPIVGFITKGAFYLQKVLIKLVFPVFESPITITKNLIVFHLCGYRHNLKYQYSFIN
jgi:hypothetical protein